MNIHTCSYYCERHECIKAQRDELRQKLEQAEDAVAAEREACAKLVEADGLARGADGYMLTKAATRIRARGEFSKPLDNAVHAIDISQERVDETAKRKDEWVGFAHEELAWLNEALNLGGRFAVIEAIEAKLKEKNHG
jgi:hypothetical protein